MGVKRLDGSVRYGEIDSLVTIHQTHGAPLVPVARIRWLTKHVNPVNLLTKYARSEEYGIVLIQEIAEKAGMWIPSENSQYFLLLPCVAVFN